MDKKIKFVNANLFWDILLSKNIKIIFGVPSSASDNILSYMPKEIEWINLGNELQNGFVSQVYGSYTNNVGILCVGTGPGIATALSAIKNAECENKPLLIITPFEKKNSIDFQFWEIENLSKQTIKYSFHIKKEDEIKYKTLLAYEVAKIHNTAVILIIDTDILLKETEKSIIPTSFDYNLKCEKNVRNTLFELSKINNTKLLVIISNTNSRNNDNIISEFIKTNNLPYVTTWKARTIYDKDLYCGRIGALGNHSANYALGNCDNILLIGNMIEEFKYEDREYHYDIFSIPLLNKDKNIYIINYKKHQKLDNIKTFVFYNFKIILDRLKLSANVEWINTLKKATNKLLFHLPAVSLLEQYALIAAKVYSDHNLEIPVTTGVGNYWYALGKYMTFNTSNCWESDTYWASIGIGIANGLGLYYATKKPVWIFEGDGGTIFSANNLFFLLNHPELPLTITIFKNNVYGAVFSSFILKKFDPINPTNFVEPISLIEKLPNCKIFNDKKKYYEYLNKNPISKNLRFIIIDLGDDIINNSSIYLINMNTKYENYLKNDDFDNILKSELVLIENEK